MVAPPPNARPKLSVCIICKNEEKKIEACLASVAWADEIILLDSGSTDNTIDIATRHTKNIHVRDDWAGFGEQRRRAEDLASNSWIFALDSDEIVTDELRTEIQEQLLLAQPENVYVLNRLTNFCGKFIYHSGWYPDPIARIYNKNHYRYNTKLVHESLECDGAIKVNLTKNLLHYTFDDLNNYLIKRNKYAAEWAKERYKNGKRAHILKAISSSCFAFIRHYFLRRGFLDGHTGLLISVIQMQYTFNKYMLLIHMHKKEHSADN